MTPFVSATAILLNEEELAAFMLDSFCIIADLLTEVSLLDNGSTDATLDIVDSYRDRLPIILQRDVRDSHHGRLRSKALEKCTGRWIVYLDGDEYWSREAHDWFTSGEIEMADIFDILKYSTILDRNHYTENGEGPSTRIFRNLPGVHFDANVHTYPLHPGLTRKRMIDPAKLIMADATACKSPEALWSKGFRYQSHAGTVGIGGLSEYIDRVSNAHRLGSIREFPEETKRRFLFGP